MRKIGKWQYTGDVSPESYGGKWFRHVSPGVYQVIELTNMDEACGRDNEGSDTYVVELSLVDLASIDTATQASAMHSCGPDDESELTDDWRAVVCYEYGCKAPLDSWSGNAYSKLLKIARSEAHKLTRDAAELAKRMEKPVNAIGSTAAEFMVGDIQSAILRGLAEGDPKAEIMAKMGMLRKR